MFFLNCLWIIIITPVYTNIKTLLGVDGIRQLHKAQEDLMEFEERALEMAKAKEEEHEEA